MRTLLSGKAVISTKSAGCSNSAPVASAYVTPVAFLPVLSRLMRSTWQFVPELIVWILHEYGKDDGLWAGFGEVFAGITLTEPTEDALLKR